MVDEHDDVKEPEKPKKYQTSVPGVINPKNRIPGVINTVDEVPEEHIYLRSTSSNGRELLWEADLLGVQTEDGGWGRLPPMIDIFCPFCAMQGKREALKINPENKPYEIEDLKEPIIVPTMGFNGPIKIEIHRLLTVKDRLRCLECFTQFEIKGGVISKVKR